jgi:transcriptional regulator GlxA family with amidase domain
MRQNKGSIILASGTGTFRSTSPASRARALPAAITLRGETDAAIGDIAAECGFESSSVFAKAFRAVIKETSRAYRSKSAEHRVRTWGSSLH